MKKISQREREREREREKANFHNLYIGKRPNAHSENVSKTFYFKIQNFHPQKKIFSTTF